MGKWVVVAFVFGGIVSAEGYAAATGLETMEIRVRFERQELTSPAAARRVLRRIGDAAAESCGACSFSLAEFNTEIVMSRCWGDAVNDAMRHIDDPLLSEAARAGRR
jgi:UrcA family protein